MPSSLHPGPRNSRLQWHECSGKAMKVPKKFYCSPPIKSAVGMLQQQSMTQDANKGRIAVMIYRVQHGCIIINKMQQCQPEYNQPPFKSSKNSCKLVKSAPF